MIRITTHKESIVKLSIFVTLMAKKRTMKLNTVNIHKIIKETIESVLCKNRDIDVNSIDISKIDINILKQSYIDLRLIPNVNEAVGEIMSTDNVPNNQFHRVISLSSENSISKVNNYYKLPNIMDKLKTIIYKCLPYAAGAFAVAFAGTIIFIILALIFGWDI